jgi:hypothetical protein
MYQVTYILAGSLHTVTTPSTVVAYKTFWAIRCKAGMNARLWGKDKKLIF